MSVKVKYSAGGSPVTLAVNGKARAYSMDSLAEKPPYSSALASILQQKGALSISLSGDVVVINTVDWGLVQYVSLDSGTTYYRCYCTDHKWDDSNDWGTIWRYTVTLIAAPYRIGTAHAFATKWGKVQTTLVGHDGDIAAPVGIVYEGPSAYFPLISDLFDPVSGEQVTFTRALAKAYGGVSFPANVPIYNGYGIRLTSDTSQDVAKVTLPTATIRTVAAQIKQTRFPSTWSIGGTALNLLTANQSDAETDTTGVDSAGATLTRDTAAPLAGVGSFKLVATGSTCLLFIPTAYIACTANQWYCGQALVKGTAAGKTVHAQLTWYTSGLVEISSTDGVAVSMPSTATVISVIGKAPATAAAVSLRIWIDNADVGNTMYVDSLMLESVPTTLTIWTAALNKLTIDTVNNLLKWTDDTTTVSATFPTALYMAGTVTDVMVIDGTSHAVTVIAHAVAGTWYTNTGTLALVTWPELTLGNLEGSIGYLISYPYDLASAEYQAITYSSGLLDFSGLRITPPVRGTLTLTPAGELSCGTTFYAGCVHGVAPTCTTADNTTVEMLAGLAARWHVTSEDWYA